MATRREVLAGAAGVALAAAGAGPARSAAPRRRYGAASMVETFREDARYRAALARHCDLITPMNDLKWEALRHDRNGFDFSGADEQIAVARANGQALRGHALLWYNALPAWAKALDDASTARRELVSHIETVAGRYSGVLESWDVVNEAISHDPIEQGPWRKGVWLDTLGPTHVDLAFEVAMKADPKAKLVLNDYDLENVGPRFEARRAIAIDVVRRLQGRNIRIDAIGLQGHLYAERPIDRDGLARFVRDLRALGVGVLVTELDVIDWRLPADAAVRDRRAAAHVEAFLQALDAEGTLDTVVTWGITDRHSWIAETFPRDDGLPPRPLPLDAGYRAKPMLEAIARYRARP
jgi:endo-1,4-beta-xylanase